MVKLSNKCSSGLTPICNSCGVALCWDISPEDYRQAKKFWDNWYCSDCNPGAKGQLKKFIKEQSDEVSDTTKNNHG